MSRYVHVSVALPVDQAQLEQLLGALDLSVVRGPVCLRGSLECHGEPVDLRVLPGPFGTIEDFGFVGGKGWRLVCGELDRSRLERELLPRMKQLHAEQMVLRAAQRSGLSLEVHPSTVAGTRRLVLRRDPP